MFFSRRSNLVWISFVAGITSAPYAQLIPPPNWTRQKLDNLFLCEGVAVSDFNRDGKKDIVAGPYWYEGPGFTVRHQIYAVTSFPPVQDSYANNNHVFPYDFNVDGWADILVVARPGQPALWYENPKSLTGSWISHVALDTVDGEAPLFADVNGDGKPELVMVNRGHIGWGYPDPSNPNSPWLRQSISPAGTWGINTHGMGLGDVNGDGRMDIIVSKNWWEQPPGGATPWIEHDYDFTPPSDGGAQIYTYDVNNDGLMDVITSLDAHGFGLAWYEQSRTGSTIGWIRHAIFGTRAEEKIYGVAFAQLHALALGDVDGDGLLDIITGKRWGTHGRPNQDDELTGPAVLYAFVLRRLPTGPSFTPLLLDTASGVGTQIAAVDLDGDGRAEILTSARRGTFVFRNTVPLSVLTSENQTSQWPFTIPSKSVLQASKKKAFAHYFPPFPISFDNKPADKDYYALGYLSPSGEGGKHSTYGGYLRERPMPRPPRTEANWQALDMRDEVRSAAAIGLDGFSVDILATSGTNYDRVVELFDAAEAVDTSFKIMLMPDMDVLKDMEKVKMLARTFKDRRGVFKSEDGKLVVAPYNAHDFPANVWKVLLDEMEAEGVHIAFVPLFQGWTKYAGDFSSISYGFSDWGVRWPSGALASRSLPKEAHQFVPIWMQPVAPQDFRPKNQVYWEAGNSKTFRYGWESAIEGGADWVQFVTWNDYSEGSELAPSTGIQNSFYDLSAYYIAWLKTGSKPSITRDALYYFHRIQRTYDSFDMSAQTAGAFKLNGVGPSSDSVEVVTLLPYPATVRIIQNGIAKSKNVPAGMSSFLEPLEAGNPTFDLMRNNRVVISTPSPFQVRTSPTYQDLLYRGGGIVDSVVAGDIPKRFNRSSPLVHANAVLTKSRFELRLSGFTGSKLVTVSVVSIQGRPIWSEKFMTDPEGNLHLEKAFQERLALGVYLVSIRSKDEKANRMVTIPD